MQFSTVSTKDYPDAGKLPLIPTGTYRVQVTEADVCPTSSGSGQYIKLKWEIMDGPMAKRTVFQNLNIRNASAEAERIGRSQLASVMVAMGIDVCNDTDQLMYKPVIAKVGVEVDKTGQYGDRNKIVSCTPAEKSGPIAPAAAAGQPAPEPAKKAPWL